MKKKEKREERAVAKENSKRGGKPDKTEGQADLPLVIQGIFAVIPYAQMLAKIEKKTNKKLQGRDEKTAQKGFECQGQGKAVKTEEKEKGKAGTKSHGPVRGGIGKKGFEKLFDEKVEEKAKGKAEGCMGKDEKRIGKSRTRAKRGHNVFPLMGEGWEYGISMSVL